MPLKLHYNGLATLYPDASPEALKYLERSRKKVQREQQLKDWASLDPKGDQVRKMIADLDSPKESKKRKFKLNHHSRQQIISSGCYGFEIRKHKVLFITLTYPEIMFRYSGIEGKSDNEALKKFINNLRTNYGLAGYVWVKELTKKGTPHYHMIIDIPYTPITKLNDMWAKVCGFKSKNCVRSDPKNGLVVKRPQDAGFYVAKYISKVKNGSFDKRTYAISNSWQIPTLTFTDDEQIREILRMQTEAEHKTEYTTIINIGYKNSKAIFDSI